MTGLVLLASVLARAEAPATSPVKDYVFRGATWGSRPPMFVIGVAMPAGEDRSPDKGLDRCGFRVAMDAE